VPKKRRILVVDDYDESREELVAALTAAGFAASGVEEDDAVETAARGRPALVILDLPAADVIEVAPTLHSGQTKIVALLERAEPMRDAIREAGVDFVVLRPCSPAHLVKLVRRLTR
jgi:DNA-binding response OmpR family regulator